MPLFDGPAPSRNVIAFSLFGANPKYTDGAILNARAGAIVLTVGGMPSDPYGPVWRFMVADDPTVDRDLLRDADSLINIRERVAVDEWIASGRHFNLMHARRAATQAPSHPGLDRRAEPGPGPHYGPGVPPQPPLVHHPPKRPRP